MNDVKNEVDFEVDKLLFDEAWLAAQREIEAVAAAKEALGRGDGEQAFLDDMAKKKDPNDTRDLGTIILELSRAWSEALE